MSLYYVTNDMNLNPQKDSRPSDTLQTSETTNASPAIDSKHSTSEFYKRAPGPARQSSVQISFGENVYEVSSSSQVKTSCNSGTSQPKSSAVTEWTGSVGDLLKEVNKVQWSCQLSSQQLRDLTSLREEVLSSLTNATEVRARLCETYLAGATLNIVLAVLQRHGVQTSFTQLLTGYSEGSKCS